jgi:predicted SprT family Zn-dependent metalloprotease
VQAENCNYFSSDNEAFLEQAKKLEAQGRHEEAALEYDKLGMTEQAEEARKKMPASVSATDIKGQLKTLTQKGQTLTYYCCHCGAPLKIGSKAPKIEKTCPRCKGDLEIIDLSKLIKQHF